MNTDDFSTRISDSIDFCINAHMGNSRSENDRIRFWDQKTPYVIHPIWCAMTLLTETSLPEDLRVNGFQALMWHDVLEDTTLSLPESTTPLVKEWVQDMTFSDLETEMRDIWQRPPVIRLLKLYDKTSNLMDGIWMKPEKQNRYRHFTDRLLNDVSANYGKLNITRIAEAILTA